MWLTDNEEDDDVDDDEYDIPRQHQNFDVSDLPSQGRVETLKIQI